MTDILTALETGIYSQLTTTAGTALWSTRVYANQAQQGATLPYCLFFRVSGGDDNVTPNRSLLFEYQVEVWATSQTEARQGAGHIDTAFYHKTLTVSGFTNYWTTTTDLIHTVENVDGKQFYRAGHDVQIRLTV